MGNLIIKGKGGAGNKLIIQDQAGAAVLTTADSGATIANATLDNATQDTITRLGTVTTGTMNNTIGSSATLPDGMARSIGFLTREQTSGGSNTGTLGGTGMQVVPLTSIRDGLGDTGSAWTNPVLTLSSNMWTMQTGIYWWMTHRTAHQDGHMWMAGVQRYGDSAGNGSSTTAITTNGVNLGATLTYTGGGVNASCSGVLNGVLEVTSTNQKHRFMIQHDSDSALGSSGFQTSSTQRMLQFYIMFQKIG